ncbi:hypothetical protein S40288_01271 [Stachybotrys chartarum IBT 40288]|nr:hypothetical protein S40288_01271 [Stachybotrys chartarum IBT 40288]
MDPAVERPPVDIGALIVNWIIDVVSPTPRIISCGLGNPSPGRSPSNANQGAPCRFSHVFNPSPYPAHRRAASGQSHMALFVDLDADDDRCSSRAEPQRGGQQHEAEAAVANDPPVRTAVTEAFQCYPIVVAVASSIDLNTLDSLARTSRQIHNGLIQYRSILMTSTLRCCNEDMPVDRDETFRYRARAGNWHYMEDGRNYNGKSGDCARDLDTDWRLHLQNCTIKPPAPVALRERHRRLCRACTRAPIARLLNPPLDANLLVSSEAVQQAICKCDSEGVWLCQPCGRSIRGADHEYRSIWRWRDHYGEVLGGLGTGIGDGDRGVVCGRDEKCCAAKERETEVDCDAQDARDNSYIALSPDDHSPAGSSTHAATPPTAPSFFFTTPQAAASRESLMGDEFRASTPQLGPGYERHEIEGIGGVVKKKLVRMVRVGACVAEWEDEKGGSGSRILGREVRGEARSWCGWCWRVIPGRKDYSGDEASSPERIRAELAR